MHFFGVFALNDLIILRQVAISMTNKVSISVLMSDGGTPVRFDVRPDTPSF